MATNRPLDFTTDAERSKWITANADYYRVFAYIGRIRHGDNYKTLAQAEKAAHRAAGALHKPVMIYAAAGVESTWVKTIHP